MQMERQRLRFAVVMMCVLALSASLGMSTIHLTVMCRCTACGRLVFASQKRACLSSYRLRNVTDTLMETQAVAMGVRGMLVAQW